MLSTEGIRAHLERLSYKDGWEFEVYEGRFEGRHLVIQATVDDSFNPGETVTLRIRSHLPMVENTSALEHWLIDRLIRIESHEAREFFRRDGQPIFDPHADGAEEDL